MGALAERLEAVPAIAGRIHPAAKLSELMARNQLPQMCPAAFVLPLGLRGGEPDVLSGLYRQPLDRLEGVLLVVRAAGDATGAAALVQLEPLIDATIEAIAGWAPGDWDDGFGIYRLVRGELVSLSAGTLTYQLDFSIDDQLRIAR